jgi:hypothetical protein
MEYFRFYYHLVYIFILHIEQEIILTIWNIIIFFYNKTVLHHPQKITQNSKKSDNRRNRLPNL